MIATEKEGAIRPAGVGDESGGGSGFSSSTLAFLRGLAANNNRDWFARHKPDYEALVLGPMRRLVEALAPAMRAIDPEIETGARSGVLSRIYRDTRFAREAPPYRVQQWIAFKRRARDWPTRPAFFMEFDPGHYRYGMGYYAATAATMAVVREAIEAEPQVLVSAMATATQAGYGVYGEAYKRPRIPQDQPAAIQVWYARKTVHLERDRAMDDSFFGPGLVGELRRAFEAAAPLYQFLIRALPG